MNGSVQRSRSHQRGPISGADRLAVAALFGWGCVARSDSRQRTVVQLPGGQSEGVADSAFAAQA